MIHKVLMPRLGANIDTVTIVSWVKSEGDEIHIGDVLAELETEKSSFELEAEDSGILRHIAAQEGTEVPYNFPLAIIASVDDDIESTIEEVQNVQASESLETVEAMDEAVFDSSSGQEAPESHSTDQSEIRKKWATPKAEKYAAENGLSEEALAALAQTTRRGFVTEKDILEHLALPPTYIYGASSGAKQILEIIRSGSQMRIVGIIDDDPRHHGRSVQSIPVIGGIEALEEIMEKDPDGDVQVVVSSHSHNRQKIFNKLSERTPGVALPPVIDRRAIVMGNVQIEDGVLIEAGCVLGHEVEIGKGAILNIGAKLSHNCRIGPYTHVAIGSSLSGVVVVGRNCLIGAGVSINPAITIGDGVIVTPGSAVLNDIQDNVTASGHPARVIGDSKRNTA